MLVLSFFLVASCDDDDNSAACNQASSEFQAVFQDMISKGHTDDVTFDTEIHEYSFTLTANREICEIGYRSLSAISSTPYLIEIVDNSTSNVIYSASHTFSSTETSYVAPSSSINLQAGVSYTIRRIQTNWGTYIDNTIGRVARKNPMDFPYSNGIMNITSAKFYQNGGPLADGVPYIDLIFK